MPYDIILGRDKADKEKFGDKGLIYLGKGYVKMGLYTSLSNKIWLDIARSHVILVAGKRGCLEGETMIFTDKGYKKIKDFNEKEDKALSFNKDTKDFEWENAKLLKYDVKDEELLKIIFEDNESLILTKEHPLLVAQGKKLLSLFWLNASELKEKDSILGIGKDLNDLIPKKIISIEKITHVSKVYDLTVPKNHSFIANGVISHNSGKSYTLGVIAEELANLPSENARNIASLIFDTMGIFWTMKYKNEKDIPLLKEWQLESKNLPVKVFVPFGKAEEYKSKSIPIDSTFALLASELEAEDWLSVFNLEFTSPAGVLIERIITSLKESSKNYTLKDIEQKIIHDEKASKETKDLVSALFAAADSWGIFSRTAEGTEVKDLISAGTTTILDLSVYSSISAFKIRALVISLISRKIFNSRMDSRKKEELDAIQHGQEYLIYKSTRQDPLVWIFIDEAHEFMPKQGKTPATDALMQLLREGRQPGISLVLATQQPGQIHNDVMTQSDIVISHRVTSKPDIEALNEIMQTYLLENIKQQMDDLPSLKGSAIILDDNSERIYPIRVRPRFTWHGGEAPTSIKAELKI